MKCLLVDDEPGIREGLAALLRRKGHHVRTAADCAAARTELAVGDFDVVVTDWRLPDGTAATFVAAARCPVVAVSGHPEEVEPSPGLRHVLTKPVTPAVLAATLAGLAAAPVASAPSAATSPTLPIDVQQVVDAFLGRLPMDAVSELRDDGTFVTVCSRLRCAAPVPSAEAGDLRTWIRGQERQVELRLCRDGRPDPGLALVRPDEPWPEAGAFAVDFHDTPVEAPAFAALLARRRGRRARGQAVHFLNVPGALRPLASSHGDAHDMPMRDAVGPRVLAEFQDLWSGS